MLFNRESMLMLLEALLDKMPGFALRRIRIHPKEEERDQLQALKKGKIIFHELTSSELRRYLS